MILGIDVSTYLEELERGAKFYDGDLEIDPLDAFVKNGVDWMRIRIWNDPYSAEGEPYLAGTCDLDHYIRLATLAKSKGFHIFMDIHYSDFWADPGKQKIPKAWVGLDVDGLEKAVYDFTELCLKTAKENGVEPEMIQIGNEITKGILWPICQLEGDDGIRGNYDNFFKVVGAGCRAARDTSPETKILLHLERGTCAEVYQEFFSEADKRGIEYDVIGASYYPFYHGNPDEIFATLDSCKHFGKELVLAEVGYGFTTEGYYMNGKENPLIITTGGITDPDITKTFPISPEGQAAYFRYLINRCKENGILGAFYWEPLWIPGENIHWASPSALSYVGEEGYPTLNQWSNQCLFDYEGRKLPAFDEYRL